MSPKILLSEPIKARRSIPFYHDKTASEFRQDPYENYAVMVTRQMRLHLATFPYPFQPVADFINKNIDFLKAKTIADIGCGVGRMISDLAQQYPRLDCYGIDYSYQLLKVADDYFVKGKTIEIDDATRGFSLVKKAGVQLENVQFALAKAEQLPFANHSLSVVCTSFALDRFSDPLATLREMRRVLQPDGKAIIISPMNFQKTAHWADFFPLDKLLKTVEAIDFKVKEVVSEILIKEPLDIHDNFITWKAMGLVLQKK